MLKIYLRDFKMLIRYFCLFFCSAALFLGCGQQESKAKVALILPITHQALEEISEGFQTEFAQAYSGQGGVKVFNAMGNAQLMQTQICQARDQGYTIIAPVGTSTTQMTLSLCPQTTIVYLAADSKGLDVERSQVALFGIQDEIPMSSHLKFLQDTYPSLKKFTLVYSPADKIFPEVEQLLALAAHEGIAVQKLLVQRTQDLFRITSLIEDDSDALFVLKDHGVVSGIEALVQASKEKGIPLVASDEGSVKRGAMLALGVREREIGKKGGRMVAEVLDGKVGRREVVLDNPSVFLNPEIGKDEKLKHTLQNKGYCLVEVAQ